MKKHNFTLLKLSRWKRLLCIGLAVLLCAGNVMYLNAAPEENPVDESFETESDSYVSTGSTDDGSDLYVEYSY